MASLGGDSSLCVEADSIEGGLTADRRSKFADLRSMLEGSKDSVKVDAMKRIINLVARGKEVSELFPCVVKNVAAKNVELKKLVYVYLARYAEEQQDLALLSISTFQRGLKDPNQLIRGSAVRVLSSIRVPMIAPIVLLAIKDAVRDMSPYVRKVAAHAIPKLHSLDKTLESELIECIIALLNDRRGLVLGSAVYAMQQICPQRMDLLHIHFRAFCKALPDIDEWGQVVMMNVLTRYARTQLASCEIEPMDEDLSLLILSVRPLLQSSNCAVVLAVTGVMAHVAPSSALPQCAHALVRFVRSSREVQYIVLQNIASLCEGQRTMFDPFLKSFFLRSSDSSFVRALKLHVLTALVNDTNVHVILRELNTYVWSPSLAEEAIDAMGRCALRVSSVSDECLRALVRLVSSPHQVLPLFSPLPLSLSLSLSLQHVVSAAVRVLKRLLHKSASVGLVERLCRLLPSLKCADARACVVWLVCTHLHNVIHIAPDLLRILAKNFPNEHESVKMETLKLAVCLWLVKREEVTQLVHYVFQLARFDVSYDTRDRARFMRKLLWKTEKLSPHAAELFMLEKPSPALSSAFSERRHLQLGSLSHILNQTCAKYEELPSWTTEPTESSLRGIKEVVKEESEEEDEEWEEDEDEEEAEEEEGEEEEEETEAQEEESEEEESEEEEEEDEEEDEGSSEEEEEAPAPPPPPPRSTAKPSNHRHTSTAAQKKKETPKESAESAMDLLLNLDFSPAGNRTLATCPQQSTNKVEVLSSAVHGLSVSLSFPRYSSSTSTPLSFTLTNHTPQPIHNVFITPPPSSSASSQTTESVGMGESVRVEVLFDAGDSGGSREWTVSFDGREMKCEVDIPLGEQVEALSLREEQLRSERDALTGMNIVTKECRVPIHVPSLLEAANLFPSAPDVLTGQSRSRKDIVIVSVSGSSLSVACPNALFAASLAFALCTHCNNVN